MVAISQWILGIRPEHDGLRIEPVIPRSWTSFRAIRRFRGTTYDIAVRQDRRDIAAPGSAGPAGDGHAEVSILVDGRPIDGTLIPLAAPGTIHVEVEVRLT